MARHTLRSSPFARVIEVRSPADKERYLFPRRRIVPPAPGEGGSWHSCLLSYGPIPPSEARGLLQTLQTMGLHSGFRDLVGKGPRFQELILPMTMPSVDRQARVPRNLTRPIARLLAAVADARRYHGSTGTRNWAIRGRSPMRVGGRVLVMGVVNVTPDSFSDGGHFFASDRAIEHGRALAREGADIIDVGGESTRPGATHVPVAKEMERVLPVIEALVEEVRVPISVDTRRPEVAKRAVGLGASIVNDVEGLRRKGMRAAVRESEAGVVAMHMRGTPDSMQNDTSYADIRSEVYCFLKTQTDRALGAGIQRDQIVIDPGIGFGKSVEGNVELLDHLSEFRALGFPILTGTSRKSFLGHITGGLGVTERLESSLGSAVFTSLRGADIVRVHDVQATIRALALVNLLREPR